MVYVHWKATFIPIGGNEREKIETQLLTQAYCLLGLITHTWVRVWYGEKFHEQG